LDALPTFHWLLANSFKEFIVYLRKGLICKSCPWPRHGVCVPLAMCGWQYGIVTTTRTTTALVCSGLNDSSFSATSHSRRLAMYQNNTGCICQMCKVLQMQFTRKTYVKQGWYALHHKGLHCKTFKTMEDVIFL